MYAEMYMSRSLCMSVVHTKVTSLVILSYHQLVHYHHVIVSSKGCLNSSPSSVGDTVIKHNKSLKGFTKHLCSSYLLVSVHHRLLKLNCSCYSLCQICQALMLSKSLLIRNITCPLISLLQSCHCLLFPWGVAHCFSPLVHLLPQITQNPKTYKYSLT